MNEAERLSLRAEAAAIFTAAVSAADPGRLVFDALRRDGDRCCIDVPGQGTCSWTPPTLIVGAGKASARMAAGAERALVDGPLSGEVIVADGCGDELHQVTFSEAGHPVPDRRGEQGARRLLELVSRQREGGVLALVSGGASSLLVAPRFPVRLEDKRSTTELLLACGADIHEVNTVRKHLSDVKGGGLLRCAHVGMVTLLLSDVVGDDPATIGSGPTVPDPTTFADAWNIVERYQIADRLPASVRTLLRRGAMGQVPETLKETDAPAELGRHLVVGSNRTALGGGAAVARRRGWKVVVSETPLCGDTREAADRFADWLRREAGCRSDREPLCLLAGGETTVRLRGSGRGGRNQEFALALVEALNGIDAVVLSAGTDGIDGPTSAAGAFVDGSTSSRARMAGADAADSLANNDSNGFFASLGDLFECGPTGTNVTDIKVALLPSALENRTGSIY